MFLPHPHLKVDIVGSLRDREVACSASDRQGSNFESCVWRTVSSQSSHHPQEVLLAQFSLYVHKGGLKPDSFHFFPHHNILASRSGYFYQDSRPITSLLQYLKLRAGDIWRHLQILTCEGAVSRVGSVMLWVYGHHKYFTQCGDGL